VFDSPDVLTGNFRLEQEVPAYFPNHARLKVWMDVVNFPNLINRKWGILQQQAFPGVVSPITAVNCQPTAPTPATCAKGPGNFYEYEQFFRGGAPTVPQLDNTSDWYMDLGIKYQF
jgi:hypothetical protein